MKTTWFLNIVILFFRLELRYFFNFAVRSKNQFQRPRANLTPIFNMAYHHGIEQRSHATDFRISGKWLIWLSSYAKWAHFISCKSKLFWVFSKFFWFPENVEYVNYCMSVQVFACRWYSRYSSRAYFEIISRLIEYES